MEDFIPGLLPLLPVRSRSDPLDRAIALRPGVAGHRHGPAAPTAAESPAADDHRQPLSRLREAPAELFDERDGALALEVARAVVGFADQQLADLMPSEST
ncbi:MAG: hypothetical protein VKN56_05075 [Cyanobacteriota bacterium]|nr:hypothetical protein [Cyanobacteriota bacterium]